MKRTTVYRAHVRGFKYHDGPGVLSQLRVGDALELEREPHNAHDANAVAVRWQGRQLGYLPAVENVSLATMLDQGLPLEARISSLDPEAPAWGVCGVEVALVA